MAKKNSIPIRVKIEDFDYLEEEQKAMEKFIGTKPSIPVVLSGIIKERKKYQKMKDADNKGVKVNYFDI